MLSCLLYLKDAQFHFRFLFELVDKENCFQVEILEGKYLLLAHQEGVNEMQF